MENFEWEIYYAVETNVMKACQLYGTSECLHLPNRANDKGGTSGRNNTGVHNWAGLFAVYCLSNISASLRKKHRRWL